MDHRLFVCWGELLWDLFPEGACLGGAPSNVAVHLAASGEPTALITRVGDDELGASARAELEQRGVDCAALQVDSELPTGRVGIEVDQGEPTYTLHPGAWQRIECDAPARALLSQCRAFCFGSLSQESAAGLASFQGALEALPADALRICDPNLRGGRIDADLVRTLLAAADVVKINQAEVEVFARAFGCSDPVRWLLDGLQVQVVAETRGPLGSTLHTRASSHEQPGVPTTRGGDNVGAGDSYTAVLARGLARGCAPSAIARAANLYGSFVASRRGATPAPDPALLEEVERLLDAANGG